MRNSVHGGWRARLVAASLLIAMAASPVHARRGYAEHKWLLLELLKARIAMKPLAAIVPPAASPVVIVEVVIDGLRRFLCRSYPLEPLEKVFPDAEVLTAESATCNGLLQPE